MAGDEEDHVDRDNETVSGLVGSSSDNHSGSGRPRKILQSGWPVGEFLCTVIPVLVLSSISLLGFLEECLYFVWFLAFAYGMLVLLLTLVDFIDGLVSSEHRRAAMRSSGRMLVGVVLAALVLAGSCAVNVWTMGPIYFLPV